METKQTVWEDDKGASSTNLMTFLSFLVAAVIALSGVFMEDIKLGDSLPFVIVFLTYTFGAKTFKKGIEVVESIKKKGPE